MGGVDLERVEAIDGEYVIENDGRRHGVLEIKSSDIVRNMVERRKRFVPARIARLVETGTSRLLGPKPCAILIVCFILCFGKDDVQ